MRIPHCAVVWSSCIMLLSMDQLDAAPGDVLVESRFNRGMDGWTSVTEGKLDSQIQLDLDKGSQRIKGGETADITWYFSAPSKFLGNQQQLYHGILQYNLGHFIFDASSGNPSAELPDLLLESKSQRLTLGARYVFSASAGRAYAVPFTAAAFDSTCKSGGSSETCAGDGESCFKDADCCSRQCVGGKARWYNMKKKRPATNAELIQVLSDVSALKIRGGYYPGGMERTWLKHPAVIEGNPFNRSDAGGGEGGGPPVETRKRSARCEAGETVTVALRPVTASGSFNVALKQPWTHYFEIPNLPEVCTEATLAVGARGELAGEGTFVGVRGEDGNMLGRLFVTAGDFSEEARACKGEENCRAAPGGGGGNQSVYMAEEVSALSSVQEDAIVIPRGRMVQYGADGTLKVGLFVEGASVVPEVTVVSMRLSFRVGGCYSRKLLGFPGLSGKPDRYSGFFTTLSLHNPPRPDDAGAILVNATGSLDPAGISLLVAFNALSSPGTFGPEYRLQAQGAGGSRSSILPTGEEWELAVAGRFFTKDYNDGRTLKATTRVEAEMVPRSVLAAGLAGGTDSSAKLAVLLQANEEGGGQPDSLSLHEVTVVYPPESCVVQTLSGGQGIAGLGDGGMVREEEVCAETWECDSSSGESNRRQFGMREECVAVCLNAVQDGGGAVSSGLCFQPQVPEGACGTAGAACECTREGRALCTLAGVSSAADGDCRCGLDTKCTRTPKNASYPFAFHTPAAPVGDVTLYVTAEMPRTLSSDHWLRVRLAERDMRILGYVFASPDCSHACTQPWADRDPMLPVTASLRVDHETAARAMSDGNLEIRIEIDEPRLAVSCALHPDSPRCFPARQPTQRFRQNSGFSELVGAVAAADTNVTIASAAGIGISQNLFQCPGGLCTPVYVRVGDEIMLVTALDGNSLTVERGVGGSIAVPHALGECACGGNATTANCFNAGSDADCTANGGTWTVTAVTLIDPLILPALANYGDVVLRSITLSYATAS